RFAIPSSTICLTCTPSFKNILTGNEYSRMDVVNYIIDAYVFLCMNLGFIISFSLVTHL
ncbi:hypothetical protein ACJX0J_024917, partial [Zea mays]